jgi:hypothetical protein
LTRPSARPPARPRPAAQPNLFTEVSTSLERSFAAVDFVDSPGLVDGDMKYPFEVEVSGGDQEGVANRVGA